jgi:integrase
MASATKRGQGRWLGRYRDPSGRERTKTFPTKGEALTWAQESERGARRGEWVDPTRSKTTVEDWSKHWLRTLTVKPKTRASYESALRCYVLPRWGKVHLSQVAFADVRAWLAGLSTSRGKPLSASKSREAYYVLKTMLDLAVEDRRLARNPAKPTVGRVKGLLPTVPKNRSHTYLTHAQLLALADAAKAHRTLVLVLGLCGLRWGEASALRVRDVNLVGRRLHIRRSVADVDGHLVFGTTKNHRTREVPVTQTLAGELEKCIDGRGPDEPLFPSTNGGWLRVGSFRRRSFDRAAEKVGLKGLKPHDLRHTAASLAIQAGANVKAVQRMLGHSSAAMTLDVYSGLFDGDLDAVAERLEEGSLAALADSVRIGTAIATISPAQSAKKHRSDQAKRRVPPAGFEPAAHGLGNRCSIP